MRHPTDGTLRRLVDEPAGVTDADREHVAACPECLTGLAAARRDADLTGAALDAGPASDPTTDVDAGWQRLSGALAAGSPASVATTDTTSPTTTTTTPLDRRRRAGLRHPVVATAGVAVLVAGAGAAAAADWLQIFRTEEVAPVTVTQADLLALPDLSAYGDMEVLEEPDVREVADAAAAEQATGLSAPRVADLPRGVTGRPSYQVGDQVSAVFTFSADEAAESAVAAGETLPPPPSGLDDSRFQLSAGPGLVAVWSGSQDLPALVVVRAVAPTAFSSGVPFSTARDYVLSLPGLPAGVASQLRDFTGDGTTLPLPLPADRVRTSTAEVGGAPATVLSSRDGLLAGVVWVDDGIATAVLGSLSTDEVLSVARGLG